ncbi:MAG: 50S ribosomal protein L4 [Burkholderiales bacterium]|nr:50S ribosomal protein L4 [Burkholderiales bacterium]
MDLQLINDKGEATESVAGSDAVFGRAYNEALVHQLVNAYLANARRGTRAQRARGQVNKSTAKPWRQKGTGRARAGMASSPLWRGGGKIFPASPDENFAHKVNRKVYRAGIATILSQLAREGRLKVVESLAVEAPKTKLLAAKLKGMGFERVLIVTDAVDENLLLSSRNLMNVEVVGVRQADPVSLVGFPHVLVTRAALAKIEEAYA